jgi:autotransporter-associated beta strand protein
MPTWDGFLSTDFLDPNNWVGFILPNQDSSAVIDATGASASFNPTLSTGQSASVFILEQSARIFTVGGTLSVNAGATLSGAGSSAGILTIANTGTVSVSGNGLTVAGGTLNNFGTLGSTLQVSGGAVNNAGVITGAVTVLGGSLTLNPDSDLSDSAVLTVNTGGTVNVDAFDVIGGLAGDGGTVQISNGNGLTIIGAANTAFSGVIAGEGFLQFEGAGTRTLSGTNTYIGGTFIDGGTLQIGAGGSTGTLGSGAVVNNTALSFNRSNTIFVANAISGSGMLTATGGGSIILTGANSYGGTTTIDAGTDLQIGQGGSTGTLGTGGVTNNGDLSFLRSDAITVSNIISGAGLVTKNGNGALTLSGTNTYTGQTTVSAGTLIAATNGALGTTAVGTVVAPGATLALQGGITTAEAIALSGSGVANGGAIRNIAGVNTLTGAITLTGAAEIQADADRLNINGTVTGGIHNLTFDTAGASIITVNGAISGSGALIKNGTGFLTLSGANTLTGATTVNAGTLIASSLTSALSDTALLSVNAPGTVALNAAETVGGLAGNGSVQLQVAPPVGTGTGRVLTIATAGGSNTFSGVISGTAAGNGLTKTGAGTQILSGNNTYSGTTTISAGTLQVGAGGDTGTLGTGAVVNNAALVFDRAGFYVVANAISGTGALTVTGGDVLALTGTNSYSGTTTINAGGTLQVGAGGSTGTLGTGAVVNNGELVFFRSGDITVANLISGSGLFGTNVNGTLTLSGANTFTGNTVVSAGKLNVTGSIASQNVSINGSSILQVDGAAISDTATVTLFESGKLTLTGSETIGALIPNSATATVNLAGHHLTLAAQTAGLGTTSFNGSAGVDRLSVTLAPTLANFTLVGVNFTNWTEGTDSVTVTGNALANTLTGNAGNNVLNGGLENDTLTGGAGIDTLTGGDGSDTYTIETVGDLVVESNATAATGGTDMVLSSLATYTLTDNVENLTLTGVAAINGTGNTLNNVITGNGAANSLNGGLGNDTLNGGAGIDTLTGGDGSDTYTIETVGDLVVESNATAATGGTDTVLSSLATYTLTDNVENLTLTGAAAINGTGNTLNNVITGNGAANSLSGGAGNDSLNGGAGIDTLTGGDGNDTYTIETVGDRVVETNPNAATGGTDTVRSSLAAYTLTANVENLTLTGVANINGTGNNRNNVLIGNSGANSLSGATGNDSLNGGDGIDTLTGGNGSDTYTIQTVGDQVVETNPNAATGGTDTVRSSLATYTLTDNVENLILTGGAAINGTGNTLGNLITGNTAANRLSGATGNDTLTGGLGGDIFRFDSAPNASTNRDSITDFSLLEGDTIQLENSVFAALITTGTLADSAFISAAAATTADQRILYDSTTGLLSYDSDGSTVGGVGAIAFATLSPGLSLTHTSFTVT